MADIINATFSEKECEDLSKMLKLFKAKNYSKTFICCSVKNVFPKTKTFKANAFENSLCLLKENLVEKYGPNFLNKFENGADISDIWEHGIEDVPVKMLYDENDVTENEIGEKKVDFIMSFRESESIFGDLTVEVKLITMVNLFSSYDLDYDNMINKLDSYISGNQKCENKEVKVENLGLLEDEIKVSLNINSERNNMKYNYMYMLVFVVNRRIMALSELFSTITLKQFIRRVNRKNNQSSLYLKCLLNEGKYKRFFNYMNIIYDEDYSFNSEFKYEIHIKKVSDMPLMFDENDYNINENTLNIKEVFNNLKKLIGLIYLEESYNVNEVNCDGNDNVDIEEVLENMKEAILEIESALRINQFSSINTGVESTMESELLSSLNSGIESNKGNDPLFLSNTGVGTVMGINILDPMNTGIELNNESDSLFSLNNGICSNNESDPLFLLNTGVGNAAETNILNSMDTEKGSNMDINPLCAIDTGNGSIMDINPLCPIDTAIGSTMDINPLCPIDTGIGSTMDINTFCPMNTEIGSIDSFCSTNNEMESNKRFDSMHILNTGNEFEMEIDQLGKVESDIDLSNYDIPLFDLGLNYLNKYPTGSEENLCI